MTEYKPKFKNDNDRFMVTSWYRDQRHAAEDDTPAMTLEEAEEIALDMETHGGKYTVRVYNADGRIVIHLTEPYEGVVIDITQDDWMGDIQDDYGFPMMCFAKQLLAG
jgi:hypothetical protein